MNKLIKDTVTIIIPNRNGQHLNIIINNFKKIFDNINLKFIVVTQNDNEPFMKGQLYNIGFKYVDTEYILLIDNDIYNFKKYNLIETYKKINQPYLGFNYITQLGLKLDNNIEEIETKLRIWGFGAFAFMKYVDFSNSGGFSNLCFLWGCEDNIIDYKLNHFKRLNNTIGHIGHPRRNFLTKTKENNHKVFELYKNKEIENFKDGYKQTLFDVCNDNIKDNIRYISVNKIRVSNNYTYLDLYKQYLKDAKEDLDNINKQDIGVSICITAYKAKDTIKETLDSVIRQTWFQKYNNYEILLGIDNCQETLDYIKPIMNNYKNLRVFMMKSNKGTYVTTNTLMKIAKYDNLIRFDSDDIMCPNMVETLMENADKYDIQRFGYIFLENKKPTTWCSFGQHLIKKSIFNKFGGYRPWICAADFDLIYRTHKFTNQKQWKGKEIKNLFYYRTNETSLTHDPKTCLKSDFRKQLENYTMTKEYNTEDDAKIECVTNEFKEIFSNHYEYYSDNYMYLMTIKNDWPDLN